MSSSNSNQDKVFDDLLKMGTDHKNSNFRRFVILHHSDMESIKKLAVEDSNSSNRVFAVQQLDDQELLFSIAQHDNDFQVRKAAVTQLKETKKLLQLQLISNYQLRSIIRHRYLQLTENQTK